MIASRRVCKETKTRYTVRLQKGYTEAEYNRAWRELKLFRDEYYGEETEPEIESEVDETTGTLALFFPTESSMSGTGYNPLIYSDIEYADDLLDAQDAEEADRKAEAAFAAALGKTLGPRT
jgi:hypothetical protein